MTIYKVINDSSNTIVEYYLQGDKAFQHAQDMMAWFSEHTFHVESQNFDEASYTE